MARPKKNTEGEKPKTGRGSGYKPNKASFGAPGGNKPGRPKADHTLRDIFRGRADEVAKLAFSWLHDPDLDLEFKYKVFNEVLCRGWGPTPKESEDSPGSGVIINILGEDASA